MESQVVVILENAPLKAVTINKELTLLHSEEHQKLAEKKYPGMASGFRPEATHQTLLTLFDSALAKAGKLKVFIRTFENVLIDIDQTVKIPRTYRRFSALFAQLLTKLKIRALNASRVLLRTIKNPITSHLPPGTRIVGITSQADMQLAEISAFEKAEPVAFVINMGRDDKELNLEHVHEWRRISNFSLSAASIASRIVNKFEDILQIEATALDASPAS